MPRRVRLSGTGRSVLPSTARSAGPRGRHPERTCVGCRCRDARSRLLRVVAGDEDPRTGAVLLLPDLEARLPGRGAWLHPRTECLESALRRRSFGRALRIAGPVLVDRVADAVDSRAELSTEHESGSATDGRPMSSQQ